MRRQLSVIGAAALPLVLFATPAVASPATCATFAAHRGYATASATENGMPAIRAARAAGAPVVEVDLARTSDSHIVLMHDWKIDRTTNGTGYVWNRTRYYLRNRVRLDDRSQVPTLGRVLDYAARYGVDLQLELKSTGTSPTVYRRINRAINSYGMAGHVTLTSFRATSLKLAATYIPGVPRALLSGTRVTPAQVRDAHATRANVQVNSVTIDYVAVMHAAGIEVAAWVVNDPARFQPTNDTGVDAITTDNVRAYRDYCAATPLGARNLD